MRSWICATLVACVAISTAPGTFAAPSEKIPESIWRDASSSNAFHLQSTMTCPSSQGDFKRSKVVAFDGFGLDVGCNYEGPKDSTVTLYLTQRTKGSLQDHFQGAQQAIAQVQPGAKAMSATPALAKDAAKWKSALYQVENGQVETGVWVKDVSGWTLKIRASYRKSERSKTLAAASAIVANAERTAGQHLAACAAAPRGKRAGTLITSKDELMSMSLMTVVMGGMVLPEDKPSTPVEKPAWCLSGAVVKDGIPLELWSNLRTGIAQPTDQITIMTVEASAPLEVGPEGLAALLDKKKSGKIVHSVTATQDGMFAVYGYFDDRPSLDALADFGAAIVSGKAQPLSSTKAGSNEINIHTTGDDKPKAKEKKRKKEKKD